MSELEKLKNENEALKAEIEILRFELKEKSGTKINHAKEEKVYLSVLTSLVTSLGVSLEKPGIKDFAHKNNLTNGVKVLYIKREALKSFLPESIYSKIYVNFGFDQFDKLPQLKDISLEQLRVSNEAIL